MKVTISGHSDDILLAQGDIFKEHNLSELGKGKVLVLSPTDHTYSEFDFWLNDEGFWQVGQVSPDCVYFESKIFTDDCGDQFLQIESFVDFEIIFKK